MGLEMRHCRRRYLPDHDHVQPLASCFYNSQESCGSFVGCLSESFSADCHRTKYDSRNDLCPASTHSIAIDSPPSVFLVQSGVASCSPPLLPFFGFGLCLTSYLSISLLSLCEWLDIRLRAQRRCCLRLLGGRAPLVQWLSARPLQLCWSCSRTFQCCPLPPSMAIGPRLN